MNGRKEEPLGHPTADPLPGSTRLGEGERTGICLRRTRICLVEGEEAVDLVPELASDDQAKTLRRQPLGKGSEFLGEQEKVSLLHPSPQRVD